MDEIEETLLAAAKALDDFAGTMEKFAITIKLQGEHCKHKRLFICGCEILSDVDVMREWAVEFKKEAE